MPSETAGPLFFDERDERGIFRETITRMADHSRSHDYVWKPVISQAPPYFPLFASGKGHHERAAFPSLRRDGGEQRNK